MTNTELIGILLRENGLFGAAGAKQYLHMVSVLLLLSNWKNRVSVRARALGKGVNFSLMHRGLLSTFESFREYSSPPNALIEWEDSEVNQMVEHLILLPHACCDLNKEWAQRVHVADACKEGVKNPTVGIGAGYYEEKNLGELVRGHAMRRSLHHFQPHVEDLPGDCQCDKCLMLKPWVFPPKVRYISLISCGFPGRSFIAYYESLAGRCCMQKLLYERSQWGLRHALITDNSTFLFCWRKGRSSSHRLRSEIRKLLAIELCTQSVIHVLWTNIQLVCRLAEPQTFAPPLP